MNKAVNIGILGTAMVAEHALVKAAQANPSVCIKAVAARNGDKAAAYATKHGIERSFSSYQSLLDDDEIDAVYLPLANHVHEQWAIQALQAGKHILCEKPLAPNRAATERIAEEASKHKLIVWEAFAYRHHPFWQRILELLPQLGDIYRIEANYCMPIPDKSWNVYNFDCAGGSMMDTGCYTVNMARQIARHANNASGDLEPEVESATALRHKADPRIDRAMRADLRWQCGITSRIRSSIWSRNLVKISLHIIGQHGGIHAYNPILPWFWNRITLKLNGRRTSRERITGDSTFCYQLENFAAAVSQGALQPSDLSDAINNMRVVDDIYRKAGLPLRQSQADDD